VREAAPITISATLNAFASSQWRLDQLMACLKRGDRESAVDELSFSLSDMTSGECPWILVGKADVSVTLIPQDELVASQLRSLKAELDHARAEWLTKQKQIVERINKLQALTNEVDANHQ
jgi:hypothetical protein